MMIDTALIRPVLENALRRREGRGDRVLSLQTLDSNLTTSYPVTIVRARLASGSSRKIFVKDFGSSRLPKTGRPPERELKVYRDLLDGTFDDAPAYLGAIWSEETECRWLVLEYIESEPLKNYGFEHWVAAARTLGRLHARFSGEAERLSRADFLAQHDATFFKARAARARESLAHFGSDFEARLDRLLADHDRLAERLGSLPPTLVHGSCRPRNLLVDASAPTLRIVAIDWELAAYGSGLYDLGFLAEGFARPKLDSLLAAYRQGANEQGASVPADSELRSLVDDFRLHKEIKSLGDARELGFSARTVDKILRLGEDLLEASA